MINRQAFLENIWLKKLKYHYITVKTESAWNDFLYAVEDGGTLDSMPQIKLDGFLGWYYEGTDIPFDPTVPITEDISI